MESPTATYINFYFIYWACWIALGIVAAVWVYRDTQKLPQLFLGSKPVWWAIATVVIGPIWVLLAYWLIHHSTISNRVENNETV
jgi:hypothetical protein